MVRVRSGALGGVAVDVVVGSLPQAATKMSPEASRMRAKARRPMLDIVNSLLGWDARKRA
jgi:hypothetical protein